MIKKLLISVILLMLFSFTSASKAQASEGIVELNNLDGSNARCFIMSITINRSNDYQLLTQCQDLIYPIELDGKYYILWAKPKIRDAKPIYIGDLGYGKANFYAHNQFTGLFITKEQTQNPSQPSNIKVMEGLIKPIPFLESDPTPTLSPKPASKPLTAKLSPVTTQTITPAQQPQSGNATKIILLFILIIIVVIIIIAIIVFIKNKLRN